MQSAESPLLQTATDVLVAQAAALSQDLLSLHTVDGVYRYVNPAFTRVLGWRPDEVIGRSAYEFFHPEDLSRIIRDHARSTSAIDEPESGCGCAVTYRIQTKTGNYRWVERRSSSVRRADGSVEALFCAARDLEACADDPLRMRLALLASEARTERDSMTGLFNKEAIKELTRLRLAIGQQRRGPTSVALLDIDHFKQINDTHGHLVGDDVIMHVAATLRQAVRREDLVGRYGGEEFVIVLPGTDADAAEVVLDRVRRTFAAGVAPHGVQFTVSAGYAAAPQSRSDAGRLIKAADVCLYAAKRAGRNRVCGSCVPAHLY